MAWYLTLQDASFKGVKFDCVSTDDSSDRDIAVHKYPYVDGGVTEDLGRNPKDIAITAVFFGTFYEIQLNAFLAKLDEPGPGELIHPVFGSFPTVQLISRQVHHSAEDREHATVQLQFMEHGDSAPFMSGTSPQLNSFLANVAMAEGWAALISDFGAFVSGVVAGAVGTSMSIFNTASSLGSMMGGTMGSLLVQVPGFTTTSNDYVQNPAAFGADLTSAMEGLADERAFDVNVMSDWGELVSKAKGVTQLPSQIAASIQIGETEAAAVDAVVTTAVAHNVVQTAIQLLQAQTGAPTFSPTEIEKITTDSRNLMALAIEKQRVTSGSVAARKVTEYQKTAVAALLDLATAVINARPPLVQRRVDAPGNLHLVAYRWYGEYARAAELLRLNPQLRNPNDITAGEVLYAYAA